MMLVFEHIGKNNKNKRLIDTITSNKFGTWLNDSLFTPFTYIYRLEMFWQQQLHTSKRCLLVALSRVTLKQDGVEDPTIKANTDKS